MEIRPKPIDIKEEYDAFFPIYSDEEGKKFSSLCKKVKSFLHQLMSRQFAPMKYLSSSSLQRVGLLNEVNMYVSRMGWEAFVMMKHPTYVVPTCEFLSSFEFDVDEGMLNFRLGNQDHSIGLFELNDVFHFPKNQEANIEYDRDEFWGEITGLRDVPYQPRMSKDSKICSHALRYLHRLMSHFLFP